MADLTQLQSAQAVTVVGADSTGTESTPVNVGAGVASGAMRTVIATDQTTLPVVNENTKKATYSASATALAAANSATDIFTITGSATKVIRVVRIGISLTKTNSTAVDIILLKRSTANSGGTSTTPTAVPLDSANAAATAVVRAYTANPTTGTLVGNIRSRKLSVPTLTSGIGDNIEWVFDIVCQPIVLRGTGEVLAFNLAAATLNGSSINVFVEWTEE